MLALAMLAYFVYNSGIKTEIEALQKRLLTTVTSIASAIDPATLSAIPIEGSVITTLHEELRKRFEAIASQDADIESIYVLRPTIQPTRLRFLVDYVREGSPAAVGEDYDASEVPVMLKGFAHPAVEDQPYSDEWGSSLSGYAPIKTNEGNSIGIVGVDVKVSNLNAIKQSVLKSVAFAFGVTILLLGTVAWYVAHNVRVPLNKIIDASVAISRGNLDTRIHMQRSDELGLMGRHIDMMAEQLQEREFIRETFGRYMSEDIAKELLASNHTQVLGGEERVVTVLFCDLEGYSGLSEKMPPGHIVEMLNKYLSAMTDIVNQHQGCVIEFIGDAVFAVFGAPRYIPDHAEQAVRCAINMNKRLLDLNKELDESGITRFWKNNNKADLRIRIGIHTGRVIAGNLGSNARMKYAVIGDTVNVASRLEALNKDFGTYTMISRDVYTQLPDDLTSQIVELGEQKIKGREQSILVYTVDHSRPKLAIVPSNTVAE